MTPEQCRDAILTEYGTMLDQEFAGKFLNYPIYRAIKARCEQAEHHTGIHWERFMPSRLQAEHVEAVTGCSTIEGLHGLASTAIHLLQQLEPDHPLIPQALRYLERPKPSKPY